MTKEKIIRCPECKEGIIEYIFTSDRWECNTCNYTNLFEPNSKEDKLNEGD